ncbi:MAG: peptidylprolyl isomerase [Bacteroidetes bacterium]|nr:peptidylprolyl isomerase [Bacteroidota bacterium]
MDKIDGIVDKNIILRSEVESQVQLLSAQEGGYENLHCDVFDQMLLGKLLVTQAELDSVSVGADEVEGELNRKIEYYIQMIGSKERFEEYYDKSVDQIKDDFRRDIREQLIASRMRDKVVGEIEITPSEVRDYFEEIPKDSLPYFNTELELSQIVVTAKVGKAQKEAARAKATDIRERIINGEPFELFCELYSEDLGSKETDCELGLMPRGTFVSAFEAAAWNLEIGEISEIVETQYGFHIIEVLERRGEMINVKHILIKAQTTTTDQMSARILVDSIKTELERDSISFFYAVKNFSEDLYSKDNGGVILNPRTGSTILETDDIEPSVFFVVDTLNPGELTSPLPYMTNDGKEAYRLIRVDGKTPPHIANLEDDWGKIYEVAKGNKQNEVLEKWIKKKARKTYIMIDDRYKACSNITSWIN